MISSFLVSLLDRTRLTADPGPRLYTVGVVVFDHSCGLGGMRMECQCWRGAVACVLQSRGHSRGGSGLKMVPYCSSLAHGVSRGVECPPCAPNLGQGSCLNSQHLSQLVSPGLQVLWDSSVMRTIGVFSGKRGWLGSSAYLSPQQEASLVSGLIWVRKVELQRPVTSSLPCWTSNYQKYISFPFFFFFAHQHSPFDMPIKS